MSCACCRDRPRTPPTPDTIATVKRLAEAGVTWLAVNGKGETPDEARAFIERFGNRVISQV